MSGRPARSPAEWVTFAASVVVLVVLVGLIGVEAGEPDGPALPRVVESGPVERHGDAFLVPVKIRNEGGATAESVQVAAELTIGGQVSVADQSVEFLARNETAEVAFLFVDDPATGTLDIRITGFTVP
ncbi:MAG: TIGR02588 family protein [Actinobacteria bacterium]|nr:TIGR02588 family protein [Actinomycetota bacterium]